jgi:hypothetical protein
VPVTPGQRRRSFPHWRGYQSTHITGFAFIQSGAAYRKALVTL